MSGNERDRIYWQQWVSSDRSSRRELITSSAAVRISPAARAKDVTTLLRQTMKLPELETTDEPDALVLVGTLYSLPKDFVKFEHEMNNQANDYSSSAHPFHLVQTLKPSDSPFQVRNELKRRLDTIYQENLPNRTIISPKLQWFYVPVTEKDTIPNCIDLDGYSTTVEPEEDEQDIMPNDAIVQADPFLVRFSWLRSDSNEPRQENEDLCSMRVKAEAENCSQLLATQASQIHLSGYLLKQSRKDPHVWRRVHCILTEEYLWYISRVYRCGNEQYAKHRKIRLYDALLLEATSDYTPLYRIPHAFELVSGKGHSHIFRATSKNTQVKWTQSLSERIVEAFENSRLDQAQLLISDEACAANRRINTTIETLCSQAYISPGLSKFALRVAKYQEKCRYIKSILPPKSPIVVSSPTVNGNGVHRARPVSASLQKIIDMVWDDAQDIMESSAVLRSKIQPESKIARAIETQCVHIEYTLTGRFRKDSEGSGPVPHDEPPPIELFDMLLSELQTAFSLSA